MIHIFVAYSGGEDWQELADIVLPRWKEYADKHGYVLKVVNGESKTKYPHYPFQRTELALEYSNELKEGDYLFIADLDVLITNPEIKIESFIDSEHDLFFTQDINNINAVNCIMSASIAKQWLSDLLGLADKARCENHATIILVEDKYKEQRKIVSHPAFNSIPYYLYPSITEEIPEEKGDWRSTHLLMHLPGMQPKMRTKIFYDFLNA